jgi:hypothetical protein
MLTNLLFFFHFILTFFIRLLYSFTFFLLFLLPSS